MIHHIAYSHKWVSWCTRRQNKLWVMSSRSTLAPLFALLTAAGCLFPQSTELCLQTWVANEGPPRQFLKLVELTEGSVMFGRHVDREPLRPGSADPHLDNDPLRFDQTQWHETAGSSNHSELKKQTAPSVHTCCCCNVTASWPRLTNQRRRDGSWCVQEPHGGVYSCERLQWPETVNVNNS